MCLPSTPAVSTTEAEIQPDEPQPAAFTVTISKSDLAAHLELTRSPEPAATPATVADALAALAAAGVTYGIDRARIAAALESPGEPVLVAVSRPSCAGEDGRVEFAPSLLAVGGRPHTDVDGRVDLFDLDLIHNVAAGAVLATRVLPTAGEPGTNVFGLPMPARPGRAAHVRAGPGTRLGDDGLQILAATAGHAALVGDVVSVSPIYHVRGDVGPATGNLEFVGSVSVSGNVDAGYRVQASGDVEIQGSVTAGEVEAAGNVSIRYGIQ